MSEVGVDPIRVLHVDDDPEIVELAATFLEREDDRLAMEGAVTGDEALDQLEAGEIHCVVSDYQLPDMEPPAFAEAIQATAPGVPIVLFTGREQEQVDEEMLDTVYTAYLQKGSGTEQYGKLAAEIVDAVASAEDVATDGGTPVYRTDGGPESAPSDDGGRPTERADPTADRSLSRIAGGNAAAVLTGILDALPDGVLILDSDRTTAYWNTAVPELTGRSGAELADTEPPALFVPEDREAVAAALSAAANSGQDTLDCAVETADGTTRRVELHCTRLTDTEGRVVALACTLRDVSDRAAYERELARQHERLEELVGAVSHDLRNPLNVVTGRIQLARETGDETHFDALERATGQMEDLIVDFVDLARKGHTVADTQQVALDEMAEFAWEEVDTADATLSVETAATVPADRERLEQILAELFENAVTHSDQPVEITLGDLDGGFYVADDGPGMDTDRIDHLLEYGETTDREATGLGLALVRRIVEGHGWGLDIVASDAGGTRVEVTGVGGDTPPAA